MLTCAHAGPDIYKMSTGEVSLQLSRRLTAVVLGVGLVLGTGSAGLASPDRAAEPLTATPAGRAQAQPVTVTLLTGDRVTLASADARTGSVQPAKGREKMQFIVNREADRLYVIPQDASRLIRSGQLDRRLFDVTGLVRSGYHDAARDNLPLIVTHRAGAATTATGTLRGVGGRVTRELPAIGGAAVVAAKDQATAFWTGVTAGSVGVRTDTAGGIEKIWLDGKRQLTLDHSVPQIGAPAAYQAGFTGRGVTVAVLDTGVDAEHPDLAGKIADEQNFSEVPELGDTVGHGTHVASIIAGSGAASDGRYRGVAPDATLVSGKVCEIARLHRVGDPRRDAVGGRGQAGGRDQHEPRRPRRAGDRSAGGGGQHPHRADRHALRDRRRQRAARTPRSARRAARTPR